VCVCVCVWIVKPFYPNVTIRYVIANPSVCRLQLSCALLSQLTFLLQGTSSPRSHSESSHFAPKFNWRNSVPISPIVESRKSLNYTLEERIA